MIESLIIDFARPEMSVVGSILLDPSVLQMVRMKLNADDFYDADCREIFKTACELADDGERIDFTTVLSRINANSKEVIKIVETTPTAAGCLEYAEQVKNNSLRYKFAEICEQGIDSYRDLSIEPKKLILDTQTQLDDLSTQKEQKVIEAKDALMEFYEYRDSLEKGEINILKTGFPSIDAVLGGFADTGLYICAARPAIGKSSLGLAIAEMVAKKNKVLFITLEMSTKELTARRLSSITGIAYNKLLFGKLEDKEITDIAKASNKMAKSKLVLNLQAEMSVNDIGLLAQQEKPKLIVIDYMGLIKPENKKLSEYERITGISNNLKKLARQLRIPILCLCQMNREAASEKDHQPKLEQLRSSGAIEQDADGVMLLHRPEYYKPETERSKPWEPQDFQIHIAKNRHGTTGRVYLRWYAVNNRFVDTRHKGKNTWNIRSWDLQ